MSKQKDPKKKTKQKKEDLRDSHPLLCLDRLIIEWPKRSKELGTPYDSGMVSKMKLYAKEEAIIKEFLLEGKDRYNYKLNIDFNDLASISIQNTEKSLTKPLLYQERPLMQATTFLDSLRKSYFFYLETMVFIGLNIDPSTASSLQYMFASGLYKFKRIDFIDCLLNAKMISYFSPTIVKCLSLRELSLDYNEFGSEGVLSLVSGLNPCSNLKQLSLNYCNIGPDAGESLGKLCAHSSLRILSLEGNHLGKEGLSELLRPLIESLETNNEEASIVPISISPEPAKKGSKAKGKKKKKKLKNLAPPVNNQMHVLNLMSNDLYILDQVINNSDKEFISYLALYIAQAQELQSINLFGNEIGFFAVQSIIEALQKRKDNKLKKMIVEITPHVSTELYNQLIKLCGKAKKGKGRKKKK